MIEIGTRLRQLREAQSLSQGDIEERTGLFRCYVSRVECGHTVPQIETLEKWAKALGVPIYRLFLPDIANPQRDRSARFPYKDRLLYRTLRRINARDRQLFLSVATTIANRGGKHGRKR